MSDVALLSSLSAQELAAAYRDRKLSPVEVTQAVIAQVERWEPHLQATWLFRPEAALEQARASEARCASASASRTRAQPASSGAYSHLCGSTATESAAGSARKSSDASGTAAANPPYAPST